MNVILNNAIITFSTSLLATKLNIILTSEDFSGQSCSIYLGQFANPGSLGILEYSESVSIIKKRESKLIKARSEIRKIKKPPLRLAH